MGGLADAFINAIMGFFKTLVEGFKEFINKKVVDPFLDFVTYTPRPMHDGELAIVKQPTNGIWPSIYDQYMQVLAVSYTFLFVAIIVTSTASVFGVVSSYRQQRIKHTSLTAIVILPLSWPAAAFTLHAFAGITQAFLQSVDLSGLFTTLLAALVLSSSIPGVNVISSLLGVLDLGVMLLATGLYIFRIMFLLFIMRTLPLLVVAKCVRVPVLEGLANRFLGLFLRFAFLPVLVALGFQTAGVLFNDSGEVMLSGLQGAVTGVLQSLFAIVIPAMTIAFYYLALQGSVGKQANRMAYSMKRRYGGTKVGDTELGEAIGDLADTAGEKAVRRGRQTAVEAYDTAHDRVRGPPAHTNQITSENQPTLSFASQTFRGSDGDPRFEKTERRGGDLRVPEDEQTNSEKPRMKLSFDDDGDVSMELADSVARDDVLEEATDASQAATTRSRLRDVSQSRRTNRKTARRRREQRRKTLREQKSSRQIAN